MVILLSVKHLCNIHTRLMSSSSMLNNVSVKEMKIPTSYGYIAGKLWESGSDGTGSSGPPPVICMHGWLDNCGTFDTLLPLIMKKPNMKVFAPDLPGHGFSSHSVTSCYDLGVEGILAIQRCKEYFKWERISLLGHSMGAIISFMYTSMFPDTVHNYVGLDNFHPGSRKVLEALRINSLGLANIEAKLAKRLPQPTYSYEDILQKVITSRRNTVTEEGSRILLKRGAVKVNPDSGDSLFQFTHDIKVTVWSPGAVTIDQAQEMALAIKCPACVIIKKEPKDNYAHRQDLLDIIDMMQTNGQTVEFHRIPGTHHFHLNDPQVTAQIINQFWNS